MRHGNGKFCSKLPQFTLTTTSPRFKSMPSPSWQYMLLYPAHLANPKISIRLGLSEHASVLYISDSSGQEYSCYQSNFEVRGQSCLCVCMRYPRIIEEQHWKIGESHCNARSVMHVVCPQNTPSILNKWPPNVVGIRGGIASITWLSRKGIPQQPWG